MERLWGLGPDSGLGPINCSEMLPPPGYVSELQGAVGPVPDWKRGIESSPHSPPPIGRRPRVRGKEAGETEKGAWSQVGMLSLLLLLMDSRSITLSMTEHLLWPGASHIVLVGFVPSNPLRCCLLPTGWVACRGHTAGECHKQDSDSGSLAPNCLPKSEFQVLAPPQERPYALSLVPLPHNCFLASKACP